MNVDKIIAIICLVFYSLAGFVAWQWFHPQKVKMVEKEPLSNIREYQAWQPEVATSTYTFPQLQHCYSLMFEKVCK